MHPNRKGYKHLGNVWYEGTRDTLLALTNRGDRRRLGKGRRFDLVDVALAFGTTEGKKQYSAAADVNQDGTVDDLDIDIVGEFFGETLNGSGSRTTQVVSNPMRVYADAVTFDPSVEPLPAKSIAVRLAAPMTRRSGCG